MKANFFKYILHFKIPGGTSRGVLKTKETWFIKLQQEERWGIGECGLLRGLSVDDRDDYEQKLRWVCQNVQVGEAQLLSSLVEFPSIQMGLQTAFKSFYAENPFQLFDSNFSKGKQGIPINGLVWMGDVDYMKNQIANRLNEGFTCIKLKIGAIDFFSELQLLKSIRKEFSASEVAIRVDANGAFLTNEALHKLHQLAELNIHSIEQPIAVRQWEEMAHLCSVSPLPIALDEELIGIFSLEAKKELIETIRPQYIILKPSFIGGFSGTDEWIQCAESLGVEWWVTSALESNIGLNAISQYTSVKNSKLHQGLGTGSLYTNNVPSPLDVTHGELHYNSLTEWDLKELKFK